MIRAIVAADEAWGIGRKGTIPWNNPADMQWFKTTTTNSVVVMGRNTWDDPKMPKPLPNRFNIVVTSKRLSEGPQMIVDSKKDLGNLLRMFTQDVWIIGGATVISANMHICEELWVSRIPGDYSCDTVLALSTNFKLDSRDTIDRALGTINLEIWKQ